jgi:hypothetical protein
MKETVMTAAPPAHPIFFKKKEVPFFLAGCCADILK